MAKYRELQFNREIFLNIVVEEFDSIMYQAIMNNGFQRTEETDYNSASYDLFRGKEYVISFSDLRAWVLEYGKGNKLDSTNPYLGDYMRSEYWADGRDTDGTVVRRGEGAYDTIDFMYGVPIRENKGTEPAGTALPESMQGLWAKDPEPFVNDLYDAIWEAFVSLLDGAIRNIENRQNEYMFVVEHTV